MPTNEYSAQVALQTIMQKLSLANRDLASIVQAAVDTGRDVQASEPTGRGKGEIHEYRKTVPYTYEEAIDVALSALEAYFVVNPLMQNSCEDNFATTAVGEPRQSSFKIERGQNFTFDPQSEGKEKILQIELRTETQLLPESQALQLREEVYSINRVSEVDIRKQTENLAHLRELLKFE